MGDHAARFDRFRCEECGEPITTVRNGPHSERWVHMSEMERPELPREFQGNEGLTL